MAVINFDYYTQKDHYTDGDIEIRLLEMAKKGESYEALPADEVSFPIVYHFSDLRSNILCWYPISKTETVLEIGAGCGAITGMLCEKAKSVTAVELSKQRATINYERNKDKNNLTIMVGNLNDMILEEKFDYIVVNGVLEYAMSFTEGDTPYENFLKKMGGYLGQNGKLLIAIENKLGLKYFAGAPEDHTDLYFYGINGYPGNQSVRTFSKAELTDLLIKSGFPYLKYYYPYPDYKFPTEIFSDESLYTQGYGNEYAVYTDKTLDLISETEGVKNFKKEKILDRFVNSFLVIAGKEELEKKKEIIYVKLNQGRKKEYRLMTKIVRKDDQIQVEKSAMTEAAVPFLKGLLENSKQKLNGNYENLPCWYEEQAIVYPYLQGMSLDAHIKQLLDEQRLDMIEKILWDFYQEFFSNKKKNMNYQQGEFCEVFGEYPGKSYYECISPANVDLICNNIFEDNGTNKIIDYEWVMNFPVPVLFIMWRMIHELYMRYPKMNLLCPKCDMMKKFGIEYSDYEIFIQWTMHFVYQYVGSDSINKYQKTKIPVDLVNYVEKEKAKKMIQTKLYYDLGNGFTEENTIEKAVTLNRNRFTVTFDLSKVTGMEVLRWNPTVGKFFTCCIEKFDCGCHADIIPRGRRIEKDDATTVFLTGDGHYIIYVLDWSKVKQITISGTIQYMRDEEIENYIGEYEKAIEEQSNIERQKIQEQVTDSALIQENISEITSDEKPNFVKTFIKRVLGRQEEPIQKEESVKEETAAVGSIDHYHYEGDNLNIIGWVFDTKYKMDNSKIAFYAQGEKKAEDDFMVVYRPDVAQVLDRPEAEACGFSYTSIVRTPMDLDVYYEYHTEEGIDKYLLGHLPGNGGKGDIEIFSLKNPKSLGNIRYFQETYLNNEKIDMQSLYQYTVDVIVPVYNGYQYFDALFESISKTRMTYRLIVVNDNSTESGVKEYLQKYAEAHAEVILIENDENLGFVRSVNKALKVTQNHVALVNSDVELPDEWLERLIWPIIKNEKIATTTPFTNCGVICSFPDFGSDNKLFENLPLWQIDDAFRRISPQYPEMPTGVGFCMGMNKNALSQIGFLDDVVFEKGYGEENDWCQRAIKAGFVNVQVDNLFVYHKHGGSFASEEKQRLIEKNGKELLRKHPNYNYDVADFCRRDPERSLRLYVMMYILNQQLDAFTVVAFDHSLGGGASEYLREKKKEILKNNGRFLVIKYNIYEGRYYLEYEYKQYHIECFAKELNMIFDILPRVDEIWINELVTYQKIYEVQKMILQLKEEKKADLKMLLHDFFSLCPAVNLMNAEGKYCDVASPDICNHCIPNNKSNACLDYESGISWRAHWKEFLLSCEEIIAFSDNTAKLFQKAYPDVYKMRVVPHKPHYLPILKKESKITPTFNIGLVGILCYKKGLEIVKDMIAYIEKEKLNIRIKLIGSSDEEIDSKVFSSTGRYTREQLPKLTLQEDIDIFLIPSICPETYSYTTSEIMSMDIPLAVFPVGAPAERVKYYEKGLIISSFDAKEIVTELCGFRNQSMRLSEMKMQQKKVLFVAEEVSFASRYRVEHFREQLLYRGVGSDFVLQEEFEKISLDQYVSVVFYRCGESSLIEKAKKNKLAVYYDIDDFVFNYDKISHLHFLSEEEYSGFRKRTENIHSCMKLCDGFFTSTNTLSEEISKEFPGKKVTINRNCASMEMQVLSHDALEQIEKDSEKIYIGYFSGSRTHDKDFEIVEEILEELMKKYSNVYLKLVGVLSEDKMARMQNRIEKLPFMEWQKLPSVIAGIDINLMPLEESLFHCCKSENKWMEAALVKVPSVMSRNKEMESVIENGKTAWLCSRKEEWYQALEDLITNPEARKKMGENAHQVVMEHYITQNTGKDAREELLCREVYMK